MDGTCTANLLDRTETHIPNAFCLRRTPTGSTEPLHGLGLLNKWTHVNEHPPPDLRWWLPAAYLQSTKQPLDFVSPLERLMAILPRLEPRSHCMYHSLNRERHSQLPPVLALRCALLCVLKGVHEASNVQCLPNFHPLRFESLERRSIETRARSRIQVLDNNHTVGQT